jgi:hypothetical protein
VPGHQPASESTALPGIILARTMIRSGGAPFLAITLHITRIHSALRSGPSPIRGRSTILGHIPIPIDLLLIATDGMLCPIFAAAISITVYREVACLGSRRSGRCTVYYLRTSISETYLEHYKTSSVWSGDYETL